MKDREATIGIPVKIQQSEGYYIISTTPESERIFGGQFFISQGKTEEEATKKFFTMVKIMCEFHSKRSNELDKWKPFQKGSWNKKGTYWITIFGLNLNFRYGKNMKFGFYVPFTKLNIAFYNKWRKGKSVSIKESLPDEKK